ncbi:gamma-glutamyltransferase (plasmid) [Mesorhizobium sp. ORM8.1]
MGAKSVAVPGALPTWCEMQRRWGKFTLADVIEPAIRIARRGFIVTPYLQSCIEDAADDLLQDETIAKWLLPKGQPLRAGDRLANELYSETLVAVASAGPEAIHGGTFGEALVACLARQGGILSSADLTNYRVKEASPISGEYRGWQVTSVPPPSAAGVHIVQMLKVLEGFDLRSIGFGSAEMIHILAETMKLAFADREQATGDPAFVSVPVETLMSSDYARQRRGLIDLKQAQNWSSGLSTGESPNTTHITIADAEGNLVCSTQTISSIFGARIMVPETGMIPNNYLAVFDPVPGRTQSLEPGKRVTTSMAPTIAQKDGKLRYALGLPGGKRIFPTVLQVLVDLFDHGMTLQEAVEAPRIFAEGDTLEVEDTVPENVVKALRGKGHDCVVVPQIAGGMNGIAFCDDASMIGASCWRADGTVAALGGGLARSDVHFWPEAPPTIPANSPV